ncbi:encapsulin-associated ferritin-like protein [Arcobacter sp. FWKO B]|uniref:encapsulin-associated ferritin-like protein n=1 Tax=Arcobacter sp. FWKO B TaxID=2593672 RepID=UPI0018A69A7A|nr:ferritin-like domain-containing protein [Arcobacter sp. FWKO B]QOG12968.1 ferritin [Arcobacter sp. FWKO B]
MAHEGFHEDPNKLSDFAKDYHRIIQSTMEELEAVDWYNQRAECASDPEAKAIMEHNRDEEIEHACMGIEWLRRNSPVWDEMLREFLFSDQPIVGKEAELTGKDATSISSTSKKSGLNIGKNKR